MHDLNIKLKGQMRFYHVYLYTLLTLGPNFTSFCSTVSVFLYTRVRFHMCKLDMTLKSQMLFWKHKNCIDPQGPKLGLFLLDIPIYMGSCLIISKQYPTDGKLLNWVLVNNHLSLCLNIYSPCLKEKIVDPKMSQSCFVFFLQLVFNTRHHMHTGTGILHCIDL